MVSVFGIVKSVSYTLSMILMIATAAGSDSLYGVSKYGLSLKCGVFKFEFCSRIGCISDTTCDAFESTKKATSAMWALSTIFILIGLVLCLVSACVDMGGSAGCMKCGVIAVDIFATVWLIILMGLVAAQPQATWCDLDVTDAGIDYHYGFFLICFTMVLTGVMSCIGCCLPMMTKPAETTVVVNQTSSYHPPQGYVYHPEHQQQGYQASPPPGQVFNQQGVVAHKEVEEVSAPMLAQ